MAKDWKCQTLSEQGRKCRPSEPLNIISNLGSEGGVRKEITRRFG